MLDQREIEDDAEARLRDRDVVVVGNGEPLLFMQMAVFGHYNNTWTKSVVTILRDCSARPSKDV